MRSALFLIGLVLTTASSQVCTNCYGFHSWQMPANGTCNGFSAEGASEFTEAFCDFGRILVIEYTFLTYDNGENMGGCSFVNATCV